MYFYFCEYFCWQDASLRWQQITKICFAYEKISSSFVFISFGNSRRNNFSSSIYYCCVWSVLCRRRETQYELNIYTNSRGSGTSATSRIFQEQKEYMLSCLSLAIDLLSDKQFLFPALATVRYYFFIFVVCFFHWWAPSFAKSLHMRICDL